MIYYLSGPMTGYEEYNYPFFTKICKELREIGYEIHSPHEVKIIHTANPTYEDYIKADIALLTCCNAIIMLPGWVYSKGAMLELQIALVLKMKVYFYNTKAELKMHILLEMGISPNG